MAGQTILNHGSAGSLLNGRSGSGTGADTNDPKWLDWTGTNYIYLPGVTGNYLAVPDAAPLDITGDIDIRAKIALDSWPPAAGNTDILGKWSGGFSYLLRVQSNGALNLYWTADGSTQLVAASTTTITAAADEIIWIRATLDVNNGAAGRDIKFYTSSDGTTWSQLGSTVTQAGTTSIYAGPAQVLIGVGAVYAPLTFYRAQVYNGIGGTLVLDIDASVVSTGSSTSFTALTGQSVTIVRSSAGRKAVTVTDPCWLFGTDDYIEVADNALLDMNASQSFSVVAVVRQWATPAANQQIVSKVDEGSPFTGYGIRNDATAFKPRWDMGDTAAARIININGVNFSAGATTVLTGIVDRSAGFMYAYTNTSKGTQVATGSIGDLSNSLPLRIAAGVLTGSSPLYYADTEILAVAVFRRVLSATEIASIVNYYAARWP